MYSAQQTVTRCLTKALNAKSNQKLEIAKALLKRAFTPVTNYIKLINGRTPWDTLRWLLRVESAGKHEPDYKVLVKQVQSSFDDNSFDKCDPYCYIFTRQDIRPEQQLVQTAHATMVAGWHFRLSYSVNPAKINFVCCGVKDESGLKEAMNFMATRGIAFEVFAEPDINNEVTCVCSHPITSIAQRKKFGCFKLLRFNNVQASRISVRQELISA